VIWRHIAIGRGDALEMRGELVIAKCRAVARSNMARLARAPSSRVICQVFGGSEQYWGV
jgi:hypothetical protein